MGRGVQVFKVKGVVKLVIGERPGMFDLSGAFGCSDDMAILLAEICPLSAKLHLKDLSQSSSKHSRRTPRIHEIESPALPLT